ncbi:MAG: PIN domain-containing protein [Chitinophagaceae bacterium]|nr:PIN domain-containing protein [Chitinophagaceae bacterium]
MTFNLLDTDFLYEFLQNNNDAVNVITEGIFIASSIITYSEMILSCTKKEEKQKLHSKVSGKILFLPIEREISDKHAELLDKYHLSHSLKINDALIAATALYYDIPLATCNTKDFKFIPNLKLIKHKVTPIRRGGGLFGLFI